MPRGMSCRRRFITSTSSSELGSSLELTACANTCSVYKSRVYFSGMSPRPWRLALWKGSELRPRTTPWVTAAKRTFDDTQGSCSYQAGHSSADGSSATQGQTRLAGRRLTQLYRYHKSPDTAHLRDLPLVGKNSRICLITFEFRKILYPTPHEFRS